MAKSVEELVIRRSEIVGSMSSDSIAVGTGRLLKHFIGECTNTELPYLESGGFFDKWDLPPWDPWICFGFVLELIPVSIQISDSFSVGFPHG
jgi:hypothetical protein